MLQHFKV